MRDFQNGDRVEVRSSHNDAGTQGIVKSVRGNSCIVNIIRVKGSYRMVRRIGDKVPYAKDDIFLV